MLLSAKLPWCPVFVQKINFRKNPRKYAKSPIFPEDPRSQKEGSRRARSGPDITPARARPGRTRVASGRLRHLLGLPFHLYDLRDVKTRGGLELFAKQVRCAAITRNPIPGTRNSVLAPCRDGEMEEIIAITVTNTFTSIIHD